MIVGSKIAKKTQLEMMLENMHASGFVFHLTGSRAWKKDVPESTDWDFFSRNEIHLGWWLQDNGFLQTFDSGYDTVDPSVTAIYRKSFPLENSWIDVQLIRGSYLECKERINEVFKTIAPHSHMTKLAWREWWKAMFQQFSVLFPLLSIGASEKSTPAPLETQVKNALDLLENNKIVTIKGLREKYGLSLCEAKDRMDMLCEGKISNERLNNYKRDIF